MVLVGLLALGVLALVVVAVLAGPLGQLAATLLGTAPPGLTAGTVVRMVVAGEVVAYSTNLVLATATTGLAGLAASALSVSSGALVAAIRRTPQTSN